jgi:hypothetical protein
MDLCNGICPGNNLKMEVIYKNCTPSGTNDWWFENTVKWSIHVRLSSTGWYRDTVQLLIFITKLTKWSWALREATGCTATREPPRILWNSKVHYRHSWDLSTCPYPELDQSSNPPTSCLYKTHFLSLVKTSSTNFLRFRCQISHPYSAAYPKNPFKPEACVNDSLALIFFTVREVIPTPNPQAGGPLAVRCLRLLIQCISWYTP